MFWLYHDHLFQWKIFFYKLQSDPRYHDNQLLMRNVHIGAFDPELGIWDFAWHLAVGVKFVTKLGFFASKIWAFNHQQAIFYVFVSRLQCSMYFFKHGFDPSPPCMICNVGHPLVALVLGLILVLKLDLGDLMVY